MTRFPPGAGGLPSAAETRAVYFEAAAPLATPVFRRDGLEAGVTVPGPAIIEEKTSTTVLHPGQRARVDEYLNLEIA
jgi:N-methylhydantoinase A